MELGRLKRTFSYPKRRKVSELLKLIQGAARGVPSEGELNAIDDEGKYRQFLEKYGIAETVGESEIEVRADPLFGQQAMHTSLISKERANRSLNMAGKSGPVSQNLGEKIEDRCDFCPSKRLVETALPRIAHDITLNGEARRFYSVSNLYPFIAPHFVTILTEEHKTTLAGLTQEDMQVYLITGKEIAKKFAANMYAGMWDIINWGYEAGMSQEHPHAQRGALYSAIRTLMDEEADRLARTAKEGGVSAEELIDAYISLMRENRLVIGENESAIAYAAFSAEFTNQVDVMTKRRGVCNYLDLTAGEINAVSELMINVLHGLAEDLNMTDLNMVLHQSRFGRADYRMHWHVCPRAYKVADREIKPKIAGMELLGMKVSSAYPEVTAKKLRRAS